MRLIDGDSLCRSLVDWMFESFGKDDGHYVEFELINKVVAGIGAHPTIDAVPVVRCRECVHAPVVDEQYEDGFDIEFPDEICPCQCDDGWYNHIPDPDWFCADGKRKDGADNAVL